MHCSRSYCQAEFRSALLPSICQLAADDNAFPWFVPSLTLSLAGFIPPAQSPSLSLAPLPPTSSFARPPFLYPRHRALFPFLYRIYSSLSAYGHVRTMQRSNGFVIELPSTANFILFWESADTHARTPRPCQDEMKFVRLFVARDRSVRCRKVFRRLKAAT